MGRRAFGYTQMLRDIAPLARNLPAGWTIAPSIGKALGVPREQWTPEKTVTGVITRIRREPEVVVGGESACPTCAWCEKLFPTRAYFVDADNTRKYCSLNCAGFAAESIEIPAPMPVRQSVCTMFGAQHRWSFEGGETPERFSCPCGVTGLDVGDWPDKQIIIDRRKVCEHGTPDPDDPSDPCVRCTSAAAEVRS